MPLLSLQPIDKKTIKECFRTSIEFTFSSTVTTQARTGETVTKKVLVLHETHSLEAFLMWATTFDELATDKNWTASDKFRNAALLLSGEAKEKWNECRTAIVNGRQLTEERFTETMDSFKAEFSTRNDTVKIREMISTAKKPSTMSIRDFIARIKQLNRYLPYLQGPLNTRFSDTEIVNIIQRSVPHWHNTLVRSAQVMNNIREVSSYYQDLEELEKSNNSKRNRNNPNDRNNNNRNQKNHNNNRNNRNEVNYNDRSNRNGNNSNGNNRNSNDNSRNKNDNGNNRNNNHNRNNNNRNDNNGNRNTNRGTGENNQNNSRSHNYNLRSNRNHQGNNNEAHRLEENNDDNSISSNSTNQSRNEVYHMHTNTPTNQEDFRPEIVVSVLQDIATKRKKIIRALVDTGSSSTLVRTRILSKSTLKNIKQDEQRKFDTLAGTLTTTHKARIAFQLVQFAPHKTVTSEVILIEDSSTAAVPEHMPDMIIGRDLIQQLKLNLDYSSNPPTIIWEDQSVPIVPRGYWSESHLKESFKSSAIELAESNFESKSPSMIAAKYTEMSDLRTFVPKHLTDEQQAALLHVLTHFQNIFSGKLGELPGEPVRLQLKSKDIQPYHGRAFPVPKIHEPLLKKEVKRLEKLGVIIRINNSESAIIWYPQEKWSNPFCLRLPSTQQTPPPYAFSTTRHSRTFPYDGWILLRLRYGSQHGFLDN